MEPVAVLLVGGPTLLLELGGLRILTDPTFDAPGEQGGLVKTAGPGVSAAELGPLDLVLLSHDQHADNLDVGGRALLADVPLTLTTTAGAARLGGTAVGLEPGASRVVGRVTVTAVEAVHGPDGVDADTGPVIGFVLAGADLPTVYVSGDNASVRVVGDVVAAHGPIDVAVLFGGAARVPRLAADLTLGADAAVPAAELLDARAVVLVHAEGWAHFSQGQQAFADAFAQAGRDDLVVLAPGEAREI